MADIPEGQKVLADSIAAPFRAEIKDTVHRSGVAPKLVGFLANADPAARKYAEWTGKACESDGLRYELRETAQEDLEAALHDANNDPDVHGIMIYYPVYGIGETTFAGGSQDDYLRDSIAVEKDVEGLCHTYRSNLYRNIRFLDAEERQKCILPCTPLAVVKIMEGMAVYNEELPIGNRMQGKTVTVINRSEIVGRPLAAMLANDGATVYSVDIDSIYIFKDGRLVPADDGVTAQSCVRQSQIVVTGVPVKGYRLPVEWVQPGTAVINVASYKNVDEAELLKVPGVKYCPLVGKVTVAMLERNLHRCYQNFADATGRMTTATQSAGPVSRAEQAARAAETQAAAARAEVQQLKVQFSAHQAIMEERMQQLISALTPRVTGSAPVTPVKNTSAAAAAAAGAAH